MGCALFCPRTSVLSHCCLCMLMRALHHNDAIRFRDSGWTDKDGKGMGTTFADNCMMLDGLSGKGKKEKRKKEGEEGEEGEKKKRQETVH